MAHAARVDDQAEIEVADLLEQRTELREPVEVETLHGELGVELAARAPLRRREAGASGHGRLADLHAQIAEGRDRRRVGHVGGSLERLALDRIRERQRDVEPAEIAQEPVGGVGREGHPAAAAALDRQPELARGRDPGLAGRDEGELLDFGAAFPQTRPKHEIRQFLLRQADAGERQVEVDRQGHRRHPPARHAGLELLPARREDEAVDVEPLAFELERESGLVEAHRAAAGKPQAGAALPRLERERFELDRAAGGLECGLDRDRDREAGCGDLRRRPEEDLGVAGDAGRAGAALACRKRDPGVDLEARVDVAAAGELRQDGPIGGKLAGRQTEGHARRHAVDAPGPGEGLAFDAHVLGEDLVGAPGRRRDRGHEKLPDAQVLEGPVAPEQLAGGKIGRQAPGAVGAGRDADLGAAEAGLGEAHLAAQERRQRDLGPNHGRGKRGRIGPTGAEPQLIDADPRPGQEPNLDPALGPGLGAGRLGERPLEGLPIGFPRHQGRRHERRREQDDQNTRDYRQDVAQRVRLPSRPVNSPPECRLGMARKWPPGHSRLRTRRSCPGS